MNKKLGFTLIELLAVILILGILALIAIPIVSSILKESRLNAAVNSGHNYMKAVENKLSTFKLKEEVLEDNTYTIKDKALYLDDVKIMDLDVKGTMPDSGKVYIKNGEITKSCLKMNGFDIAYDGKEMFDKDCKYAFNLIKNGYLENKNNDNFSRFNYSDGYISVSGTQQWLQSDEFIEINPNKAYNYSLVVKSSVTNSSNLIGLVEYDVDKKPIIPENYLYVAGTTTKLTQDLNNGDTVMHLEDNNFVSHYDSLRSGFIIWNYTDSTGYTYPPETYSRNVYINKFAYESINTTDNTITLKAPWNGGTIEAGTYLSQRDDGMTHNYILKNSGFLSTEEEFCQGTITGVNLNNVANDYKFRPGTKYVKLLVIHNQTNIDSTATTYLKDIVFEEVK